MLPSWKYKTLENIVYSDFAEVTLLLSLNLNQSSKQKRSKSLSYSLISLYEKSDRIFCKGRSDFNNKKNASGLIKNIIKLDLKGMNDFFSAEFNNEEINEIKSYNLDAVINLASIGLKENYHGLAKYGIWSFYLIDDWKIKGTIKGFWELAIRCSGSELFHTETNNDPNAGIFIYRIVEATDDLSLNVNKNKLFWRASLLIPRILKGICREGENFLNHLIIKYNNYKSAIENESYDLPSLMPSTKNFFSSVRNRIGYKLFYTGNLKWFLYFGNDHNSLLPDLNNLQRLDPPLNDRFWADPFPLSKDGKNYIFVEELFYKKNVGHISLIELSNDGKPQAINSVIEKPYHISFPFVFKAGYDYLMVPETSANKSIDIYKCTSFPHKWEFVKSLMKDLRAVDTVLFYYVNKWWLFTTIDETDGLSGGSTELFLFFNDDLFSDSWKSHPQNPIITDVRISRPAGRIFIQDGKIYRPSQDCSGRYGRAINIRQILALSETEYNETPVYRITPDWDKKIKGTHTYNFDNNFVVADAYSFRRRTLKHIK
jgi:hypothetical protein